MTFSEFIFAPIIAFLFSFTFGYIVLSLYSFVRKSVW